MGLFLVEGVCDDVGEMVSVVGEDQNRTWLIQEFVAPAAGFTTRIEILGEVITTVLRRFVTPDGISSYSRGSSYALYPECAQPIREAAVRALRMLKVDMAGLDFIEARDGTASLIDVNPTSNFTPDYIPMLGFDPIERMADFVLDGYRAL